MSDDTPTQRNPVPEHNETGDDAPTRRFPQMPPRNTASDDTPTQRYTPPVPPVGGGGSDNGSGGSGNGGGYFPPQPPANGSNPPEPPKKSRALLATLITVGALLLIAVIVLLVLLFGKNSGSTVASPSESTSPSASATPSESPTPSTSSSPSPSSPSPSASTPPPPAPVAAVGSFTVSNQTVSCTDKSSKNPPQLAFSWTSSNAAEAFFGVDTKDASVAPLYSNLPPNGDSSSFPEKPFSYACPAASHQYTITVVGDGAKASKTITVTNNGFTG